MPSPVGLFSLQQMANGSLENYYDPKLIYDPTQDRFVLVFIKTMMLQTVRSSYV